MSVSGVSAATFAANSSSDPSSLLARTPQKVLNQDDFLKLLMAQFKAQDPMSPMKDTEFVAQMAQFTALEQAKATGADITTLKNQEQVMQANAMIGRSVLVQNADGTLAGGTVSAVQLDSGTPSLVINGQTYGLSQVLSITQPTTSN